MTAEGNFPIPASLQDLERAPYNLLPYPVDFDDDDEAVRAESFSKLVTLIQEGNSRLERGGISLFQQEEEPWMHEDRMQALYTLVRYVISVLTTVMYILKAKLSNRYSLCFHVPK